MPLFLDVATMVCFAFASGMVFVLHFVEQPAYALLTGLRENIPESTETKLLLTHTKNVLGQFLAVRVPQIKAGLLMAGTAYSAVLVYTSGNFISRRGLLVLCGIFFVPIMAKQALPAAQRVAAVSPSATTAELGAALRPLLKTNRIGTLATLSFFLFSMLVSWLD